MSEHNERHDAHAAPSGGSSPNVLELLVQSGKDMFTDNAPQWAAAIAYYALLSVFPLLLATVSIAGYFVNPQWAVGRATALLGDFLPQGQGIIEQTVRGAIEGRQVVSPLAILALLWTGSRVFAVLTTALNVAYDVDEMYGLGKRLLIELGMLLTVGLLFILAVSSGFFLGLLWQALGVLPEQRGTAYQVIRGLLPAALLLVTFFLIYRFVPRARPDWKAALAGAAVATLLFLLARPLFLYYIQEFARYNLIYGSLSIVIILLVWAWLVSLIVLFGGEIASHVQMMWIEGESREEVERRHEERSPTRKRHRGRTGSREDGRERPRVIRLRPRGTRRRAGQS